MSKYKVNFEADIELEKVGELKPHIVTNLLTMRLEADGMSVEDAVQAGRIAKPDVEDVLQDIVDLDVELQPVTREMIEEVDEFEE